MNASAISSAIARPYYTANLGCLRFSHIAGSAAAFKLTQTSLVKKGKKCKLVAQQKDTVIKYSATTLELRALELVAIYYALVSVERNAVLNALMHKDTVHLLQEFFSTGEAPADPTEALLVNGIATVINIKNIKFNPLHVQHCNSQRTHDILVSITENAFIHNLTNFMIVDQML